MCAHDYLCWRRVLVKVFLLGRVQRKGKAMRRVIRLGLLFVVAGGANLGCDHISSGFQRFQLINHTPHEITYYAISGSEAGVRTAANQLSAPIAPNTVYGIEGGGPGFYWLRAIANVDGVEEEHLLGPVWMGDGLFGWAWRMVDGAIRTGTGPEDLFAVTDLPAVVIDPLGRPITDQERIPMEFHIAWDPDGGLNVPLGSPADYAGPAGINIRGNSSKTFPKKSWRIEIWDEQGNDRNVSLLGMPREDDWILYGPWMDRSLLRNVVGYDLARAMGQYAPRTRFVEVWLKEHGVDVRAEDYHGVYVLAENVKRDNQRVDIARLFPEDTDPELITGGYILEMVNDQDQQDPGALLLPAAGGYFLDIREPKPDRINQVQLDYVAGYMADFEAVLFGPDFADPDTGYAQYIDVDSFVDHILLQDFFRNRDAFRASAFMHKDRGGKLVMGPIWDLNIIWGYFSFAGFDQPEGWFLQEPNPNLGHSPWTDRLFQDPAFVERYIARWRELRQGVLATPDIFQRIDRHAEELQTAQARNFLRWPSLGITLFPDIRFLMFTGPHPTSWEGEIDFMKDWLARRATWMDAHIHELRNL